MRSKLVVGVTMLLVLGLAASARAQDQDGKEDMNTTLQALKQRIKDQDRRLAELEAREAASKNVLTKDDVRKVVDEMYADAAKRSSGMPKWAENLKFSGDFRLRYDGQYYDFAAKGSPSSDQLKDRNRARYRLRFGFVKTWMEDQMEVGFRLASGNSNDPTSTNQTMGESGGGEVGFAKRPVWVDLAYAKYAPKELKGLSITGGKMINPMLFNDLFWDTDVNPEGFWAEYKPTFGNLTPFVGGGYFIVKETNQGAATTDSYDVDMWAIQLGATYAFTPDVKYTLFALYNGYSTYGNSINATNGNDTLANISNFRIIDVGNKVDFKLFNIPFSVFFDWAHNCANSDPAVNYDNKSDAYATGLNIGQNKKKGDWSLKYRYGYIQANSLPGQYVDSDFGFANRKGHVWGGTYNVTDDLTAGLSLYYTSPIHAMSNPNEGDTTTLMADLVWKF